MNISIREPKESDAEYFIKTMIEDQDYHDPWINAPKSEDAFKNYLAKSKQENNKFFLIIVVQ